MLQFVVEPRVDVRFRARSGRAGDGATIARILSTSDARLAQISVPVAQLFDRLLATDEIKAGCIELSRDGGQWQTMAVGVSAFLPEEIVSSYLAAAEPYLAARLLQRCLDGETGVLMQEADIAVANASDGLNLFILGFAHVLADNAPELPPLLAKAIEHFLSAHAGFRLKRLIREDPTPVAEMFLRSGMRAIATFPAQTSSPGGRMATLMERADVNPLFPYSPATALFHFRPPQIGFSRSERRFLAAATEGFSDSELTSVLGLSANTIKRLWRIIFDRVASRLPYVLGPDKDFRVVEGVRGPEKRRHLLAYLRDNPQELRPYALETPTR